jgi:hypothetical protein
MYSEHASWSKQIKENNRFRDEFIKAVAVPPEGRRREPMEREKYLVEEEQGLEPRHLTVEFFIQNSLRRK